MRYPDNCPPRKIPPLVRVGVWVTVRVRFRVGGQPDNPPMRKIAHRLGLGFGLGLVLGLGGGGGGGGGGGNFPREQLS